MTNTGLKGVSITPRDIFIFVFDESKHVIVGTFHNYFIKPLGICIYS